MQILFIRHGQSEADILNVHEGRADFELTELGRRQVKAMAARVKENFPPDFIWASTLKRAKETASILAEMVGCPVKYEDELMEYNNGVLAGLSFEEGKKYDRPKTMHDQIEKGESAIEFRMRIESIFSRILSLSGNERIAIVAHGGVINNLLRSFYKMPVNKEFLFKNGDTAIHLVEIEQSERIVHFLNSTVHLEGLI
ncbi:histidine phosphatase family protein [Paenibacillus eucommiae]|uniref:2,3-bisphosphoglycerate-dependent phosphoglycerate mutase n=1 Tax=Paenibacillus eucommiae TaxID=1355755 RepID=A0ABS4IVK8_9BACL|nr:histidine phosphatase family protein [Paenibacillus eucommiae]MBP1991623.1 2,3-bisphosphoglycerate-dependent phosphoglycerate mutase [Paenibacillus eucommiae]